MTACGCAHACVETVPLLLETSGDPSLAAEDGFTPKHAIAQHGHTELVGMLHSNSPDTIHTPAPGRVNSLFMAYFYGQAGVVSRLLSLGAIRPEDHASCPLITAVNKGFLGVVRAPGQRGHGGGLGLADFALCAVHRRMLRKGENPRAAPRGGGRGEALGVGQQRFREQTTASLWCWVLLSRCGERSPQSRGERDGARVGGGSCPSRPHRG